MSISDKPPALQKYRILFIFVGLVLVVVLGERFFRSSPVADDLQGQQVETDTSDVVVTSVRQENEIGFQESEFTETNLKSIEQVVVSQAVEAAKGLLSSQAGGGTVDLIPSSKSRIVTFSDQQLGVVEVALRSSDPSALNTDAVYFTRVFGFVSGNPISVSCVRPSGKLVSILSGECGLRIAEVFQLDLE